MSAKFWLNPPRGAGVRWVEPTLNNNAFYSYGNRAQRTWRFPINTATDNHPLARHWLPDYSYGKGVIIHQMSPNLINASYMSRPFTRQWLEQKYSKYFEDKWMLLPWAAFIWCLFASGMRAYDNSAYDYFYFTD